MEPSPQHSDYDDYEVLPDPATTEEAPLVHGRALARRNTACNRPESGAVLKTAAKDVERTKPGKHMSRDLTTKALVF